MPGSTGTATVPGGSFALNVGGKEIGENVGGAIVGGTGKYAGAVGTFSSKATESGHDSPEELTFSYTLAVGQLHAAPTLWAPRASAVGAALSLWRANAQAILVVSALPLAAS